VIKQTLPWQDWYAACIYHRPQVLKQNTLCSTTRIFTQLTNLRGYTFFMNLCIRDLNATQVYLEPDTTAATTLDAPLDSVAAAASDSWWDTLACMIYTCFKWCLYFKVVKTSSATSQTDLVCDPNNAALSIASSIESIHGAFYLLFLLCWAGIASQWRELLVKDDGQTWEFATDELWDNLETWEEDINLITDYLNSAKNSDTAFMELSRRLIKKKVKTAS